MLFYIKCIYFTVYGIHTNPDAAQLWKPESNREKNRQKQWKPNKNEEMEGAKRGDGNGKGKMCGKVGKSQAAKLPGVAIAA